MRITSLAGFILTASFLALGQSNPLAFEVATIKPAPPPPDGRMMIRMGGDAGRIDWTNVSMRDLIRRAFNVKDPQISGPDWMRSERYNIVAKFPAGATRDQVPAMLQTLLADRFKLTIHKEQKVLPAYVLLVAKGGPKLEKAETEARLSMMMSPRGRHLFGATTLPQLADALSNVMDHPVIDKTELTGTYNVDLEWTGGDMPNQLMRGPGGPGGPGGPEGGPRPEAGNEDAPTIYTALQEKLGLRLDQRKESVDIVIVDQVNKVPTDN